MKIEELFENINIERNQVFASLADNQRGKPEQAMVSLVRLAGGGVIGIAEHIGDLTHRMSEKFDFLKGGLEYVKHKVNYALKTLTNPYGFEREFEENLRSNAKIKNISVNDLKNAVFNALKIYANEHAKLKVYNEPQMWARNAAISFGNRDWDATIDYLKKLKNLCNDPEKYYTEVSKFENYSLFEAKDAIQLPKLEIGDELLVGKFKNRKATIKGFTKDKNNQPIAQTNKGPQAILKPRIPKLFDEALKEEALEESNRIFSGVRLDEIPQKYRTLKVLGRGATSIVLEKDSETVLIFTRDEIKKDWLVQNWGLSIAKYIDSYDSHKHHIRGFNDLPIHVLEMPKLYPLNSQNRKVVTSLIKEFDSINKQVMYRMSPENARQSILSKYQSIFDKYEDEFKSEHQFKVLIDFLMNYDSKQYQWDLGPRNFMQTKDGKLVVLDPVVAKELLDLHRATGYIS
jgi:hypothetical protein